MTFLTKLWLIVGFAFTVATAIFTRFDSRNYSEFSLIYRLPDVVVPQHYDIELKPYITEGNRTIDGKCNIMIEIRRWTRHIRLHAYELVINEEATLLLNKKTDVAYKPRKYDYHSDIQILIIDFDEELPAGSYLLFMKFVALIASDVGFIAVKYADERRNVDRWLFTTRFDPTAARRLFPCWDEPTLKATYSIQIKHPHNYSVLSNMPMSERLNHWDGEVWTYFYQTTLISTYQVAIMMIDLSHFPSANNDTDLWCRPQVVGQLKFAQDVINTTMRLFRNYTNSSKNTSKATHVIIPNLPLKQAMESSKLIVYREANVTYNEDFDPSYRKVDVATAVTREIARQQFGSIISPTWWNHIWLNVGLSSLFEQHVLAEIFKDRRHLFDIQTQLFALHQDVHLETINPLVYVPVRTPAQINILFSPANRAKASAIIRMVQHMLTKEVFWKGVMTYLDRHEFGWPDDFWTVLQDVINVSNVLHGDYQLKDVMSTWLWQRHYPLINVTRNYDTGKAIVTQKPFSGRRNTKWWVPVTFATRKNLAFLNTFPTFWLKPSDHNVTIDELERYDWIIINVQQVGYYRVNYDPENWRKIAKYLNCKRYIQIHVLNRAQIIDDAYHLLMEDQLDFSIFLELTKYLWQEKYYIPWYAMERIFLYMSEFFQYSESTFIKQHMLEILDGLLNRVGYAAKPGDDDTVLLMRVLATKWACNFGHSGCRKAATAALNEHLANPEKHIVVQPWHEWTYCAGIMTANASTWNKMMDLFARSHNPIILEYLTCSENPSIIIDYLNAIASSDRLMRMAESSVLAKIYRSIMRRHASKDSMLQYILENFDKVKPRGMYILEALTDIIQNVYTKEHLDKIWKFANRNPKVDKKLLDDILYRIVTQLSRQEKVLLRFEHRFKI